MKKKTKLVYIEVTKEDIQKGQEFIYPRSVYCPVARAVQRVMGIGWTVGYLFIKNPQQTNRIPHEVKRKMDRFDNHKDYLTPEDKEPFGFYLEVKK